MRKYRTITKKYRPVVTAWGHSTIRQIVKLHKRRCRHNAKQYLKTGHYRDKIRSERLLSRWDFD